MRQVLLRAVFLLRRPAVLLVGVVLVGGGSALAAVPLFGLPGYELGAAMALAVGVLGGVVGAAAAFTERQLIQSRDPRPRQALRQDSPLSAAWMAGAAALALNTAFLVPALAVSVLHALLSTPCDPFALIGFYPVLTLPSATIASAAGVLCGFAARRGRGATALYLLMLLGSAAATAWPLVFGPQIFAFNHFGGYLPGPLYDEALSLGAAVGWFRLQTLLIAAALGLLAALCLDMREGRATFPRPRPGVALLLGLTVAGAWILEQRAPELGFRMTEEHLTQKLGGLKETAHFLITYPRGKPREELERLSRDLEFRHAQIAGFLGGAPAEKIRVYVYRSAAEKQALVGAAHTQFAKPWRLELHINDGPFPHAVAKHELVHVMAAPYGSGPFRVTTRYGVWPLMGIIEGMAVAGDNAADEMTLHQWAAGMRQQKLMPDIRRILGPSGFYESAPARAYTVVGSFLRYLGDTHGQQKLTALYAHGDFQAVYGQSVDALATEWEKFLDSVPLDAAAVNQAFARFRRGSLFARPCAREVASLQGAAVDALSSDPDEALALYRRCSRIQPEEPSFRLGEASALSRLDRQGEASAVLGELQVKVADQPALASEVAMAQADLAFWGGKAEEARKLLERVVELKVSAATDRTARVKLAALAAGAPGQAIWSYLQTGQDPVRLLQLKEAQAVQPRSPWLTYLIGRRLEPVAPRQALGYLDQALQGELPDSVRREALRLQIEALYLSGDCAGVRDAVGRLPDLGEPFKVRALEWVQRCDFEDRAFKGPLLPDSPFR